MAKLKSLAEQTADGCRNLTATIPHVAPRPYRQHIYMAGMPVRKSRPDTIANEAGIREMVLQALRNRGNTLPSQPQ